MAIDAVIPWVDGFEPAHLERRRRHLPPGRPLDAAVDRARFADHQELRHCLRGILRRMGWIRRIHILVDRQFPSYLDRAALRDYPISFVDHAVIFDGLPAALPTFNSRAIHAAMHRIPDLAERFLLFDDDFFVVDEMAPSDFFDGERPIVRAREYPLSSVLPGEDWRGQQARAAMLAGYPGRLFAEHAHAPYALRRSRLAENWRRHGAALTRAVAHRFREDTTVGPVALAYHVDLVGGQAVLRPPVDVLQVDIVPDRDPARMKQVIAAFSPDRMAAAGRRFGCVNNLGWWDADGSAMRSAIEACVGPPLAFERPAPTGQADVGG